MRVLSIGFGVLFMTTVAAAQAPAPAPKPAAPAARPAAARPAATLAQLMRGILFPNSNILFDAQTNDPAKERPKPAGTGALVDFCCIYTGWPVVENAALALNEVVDLLSKPGRLCDNGKPAPINEATYKKGAQMLRDSSLKIFNLAKAKNLEMVSDAANDLADACATCHEVYRDRGDAQSPLRCVAAPAAK
jgi:hypothetical protein